MPVVIDGTTGVTANGVTATAVSSADYQTTSGFYESSANVTSNFTITTGYNAMSVGPITINTGVIVTIPNNSTWVVV